jgi:hypothetical protein
MDNEKPNHFRPDNRNVSACGVVNPAYAAYDPRDCDCGKCKNTTVYLRVMGKLKGKNSVVCMACGHGGEVNPKFSSQKVICPECESSQTWKAKNL